MINPSLTIPVDDATTADSLLSVCFVPETMSDTENRRDEQKHSLCLQGAHRLAKQMAGEGQWGKS